MKFLVWAFLVGACGVFSAFSQTPTLPYKNSTLPTDKRVADLLSRMTPEEKFRQLFSVYFFGKFDTLAFQSGVCGIKWNLPWDHQRIPMYSQKQVDSLLKISVAQVNDVQRFFIEKTRLGIPTFFIGESLHGCEADISTSFPQSIALAATFNSPLMGRIADAIALETQQHGFHQVLSPVINLGNDVRWGRVEETYGEDPFLNSILGVAFVRPFEKRNLITTPKHFIANVGDGGRDSYPIHLDERTLNNYYYPPFKACIQEGGSRSIMSAYNSVNGKASGMNPELLQQKLRKEWGFNGFVISDAGAVGGANVLHNTSPDYATSGKKSVENGLDVIYQGDIQHHTLFEKPFLDGSMNPQVIDSAVSRILRLKFELGLFENPYLAYRGFSVVEHQKLAREAAEQSVVLLKNEGGALPLSKQIKSIAVIGADAVECRTGGYSGSGIQKVSFLEGLKKQFGNKTSISYTQGTFRKLEEFSVVPKEAISYEGQLGWEARYFNDPTFESEPIFIRREDKIDFHYTFMGPDDRIRKEHFAVEYRGNFQWDSSFVGKIGLVGNDGFRLYIDGKLVIDQWEKVSYHTRSIPVNFTKGRLVSIRVQFKETAGNAKLKFIWDLYRPNRVSEEVANAVEIAQKSEQIIFCAGIEEGEFQDRSSLSLPGNQVEVLNELIKLRKKIVVVLFGGSAVTMDPWLDQVDAVVEAWYGGEQQGNALARILTGEVNPSGKLPITFPRSEGQLPLVYNHEPTGRGDDYVNESGLPLFPFGFGLSYTEFSWKNLSGPEVFLKEDGSGMLTFQLKNEGKREGTETVQLYVHRPVSRLTQPVLALKGVEKVTLKPGESRTIQMAITPKMLKQFNDRNEEILEPGPIQFRVGSSSRELPLIWNARLKGE